MPARTRALAALALAQAAVGAAAVFARFALDGGGGPFAISAARLTLASLVVVTVAGLRRNRLAAGARARYRLIAGGVLLGLHFATWIASLRFASIAVATLLVTTTPMWTECWLIARRRRVDLRVALSVALGIAGVAIVAGVPSSRETPLGIALALAGAAAIAGYLLLVGSIDAKVGTLDIVARTYPVAAITVVVLALVTRDPLPPLAHTAAWGGIVAMAFVSQLLGHTGLNLAVRTLGATFVGMTTLLEPIVAAIFAALIFGERLAPATLLGGAVVLTAIGLALRVPPATAVIEPAP